MARGVIGGGARGLDAARRDGLLGVDVAAALLDIALQQRQAFQHGLHQPRRARQIEQHGQSRQSEGAPAGETEPLLIVAERFRRACGIVAERADFRQPVAAVGLNREQARADQREQGGGDEQARLAAESPERAQARGEARQRPAAVRYVAHHVLVGGDGVRARQREAAQRRVEPGAVGAGIRVDARAGGLIENGLGQAGAARVELVLGAPAGVERALRGGEALARVARHRLRIAPEMLGLLDESGVGGVGLRGLLQRGMDGGGDGVRRIGGAGRRVERDSHDAGERGPGRALVKTARDGVEREALARARRAEHGHGQRRAGAGMGRDIGQYREIVLEAERVGAADAVGRENDLARRAGGGHLSGGGGLAGAHIGLLGRTGTHTAPLRRSHKRKSPAFKPARRGEGAKHCRDRDCRPGKFQLSPGKTVSSEPDITPRGRAWRINPRFPIRMKTRTSSSTATPTIFFSA